jgi:hypothetical protein
MITFPIGSYFLSVNMLFGGKSYLVFPDFTHYSNPPSHVCTRIISCFISLPPPMLALIHINWWNLTWNPSSSTAPDRSIPGNSTYAGATAAIVANIVLIAYVVVAFNDDKSEREADIASGVISPPSEGRKEK